MVYLRGRTQRGKGFQDDRKILGCWLHIRIQIREYGKKVPRDLLTRIKLINYLLYQNMTRIRELSENLGSH